MHGQQQIRKSKSCQSSCKSSEVWANQNRKNRDLPHTTRQDQYHQGSACQIGHRFLRIHYLQKQASLYLDNRNLVPWRSIKYFIKRNICTDQIWWPKKQNMFLGKRMLLFQPNYQMVHLNWVSRIQLDKMKRCISATGKIPVSHRQLLTPKLSVCKFSPILCSDIS